MRGVTESFDWLGVDFMDCHQPPDVLDPTAQQFVLLTLNALGMQASCDDRGIYELQTLANADDSAPKRNL